jgi:adenylate cyclase
MSEDQDLLARLDTVEAPFRSASSETRLAALTQIGRIINSILDIDQILDIIMDELIALVNAERGFVTLIDPETSTLTFRVARNLDRATLDEPAFDISRSVVDQVYADQQAVLSFNAAEDPRWAERPSIQSFGLRGIICVPLRIKARCIGVIYLDNRLKRGGFDEDDLDFVRAFADQTAIAIDNANLDVEHRRLRELFEGYVSREVLDDILGRDDVNLAGQRCVVTVMFCDIRGFTSLSEVLDPAALVGRLNQFYQEMGEIIFRHGGILFTYMGDAIMAVFGAPTRHPDHPIRAVKAALDMCKRMDQLVARWKASAEPTFEVGIGLCTGEVIAGDVGFAKKREYTVIGDTVNTAARMEKLNKAFSSRIVMSESTRQAIHHALPVERLGTVEVRGKSQPMEVWSVAGFGARSRR